MKFWREGFLLVLILWLSACELDSRSENGVTFMSNNTPNDTSMRQQSVASYATLAEAKRVGAVETGHVPVFVPPSATNLQEAHAIDTVQSVLTFDFDPADLSRLTRSCQPVGAEDVEPIAIQTAWVPPDLQTPADAPAYMFFACSDEGGYLAVDRAAGKAFFWRS